MCSPLLYKPTHRASAAGGYTNRLLRLSTTTSPAVRTGRPPVAGSVTGRTRRARNTDVGSCPRTCSGSDLRSEEHTSELQSRLHLVCRLLLEKKKIRNNTSIFRLTVG